MSSLAAIDTPAANNGANNPSTAAPNELGLTEADVQVQVMKFPTPPKFDDPYKERAYLKGRLAGKEPSSILLSTFKAQFRGTGRLTD